MENYIVHWHHKNGVDKGHGITPKFYKEALADSDLSNKKFPDMVHSPAIKYEVCKHINPRMDCDLNQDYCSLARGKECVETLADSERKGTKDV